LKAIAGRGLLKLRQVSLNPPIVMDGQIKRSRFPEEQITAILREQHAGAPVADLHRKHGLSPPTFSKLKAKYGGLDVSEARREREAEADAAPTTIASDDGTELTPNGEGWADEISVGWR
jgi:putative transposase